MRCTLQSVEMAIVGEVQTKGERMSCQRCKGLLIRETSGDLREEAGCMHPATRCINCGYIEDSVMRANRLCPPEAKRAVPRMIGRKGGVVFNPRSARHRSTMYWA